MDTVREGYAEQTGENMFEDEFYHHLEKEFPDCKRLILEISQIVPPKRREWQTLMDGTKKGDPRARERLVQVYLHVVMEQAYVFSRRYYCDFEDAFQDGVLGLLHAVDQYDMAASKNVARSFQFWIIKSMQRCRWEKGSIMRYPSGYEGCVLPYQELSDIIFDENLDEENIRKLSGDRAEPVYEQELEAALVRQELSQTMQDALMKLDEKQRGVIEYRFGFRDGRRYTLKEVGEIYHLSKERVRQIEAKAIARLRLPNQRDRFTDFLS